MRWPCLALSALAAVAFATGSPLTYKNIHNPLAPRQTVDPVCSDYLIIETRGTGETQGPSAGFVLMNGLTLSLLPTGNQYYTVYPAASDQISVDGTTDIVNKIAEAIAIDPARCVILQGYSQGASATVNALALLNGTSADAVKAIFLIGNPLHKPGLACNVDDHGSNGSANALGLQLKLLPNSNVVPDAFVARTLDVCIPGDGICDSDNGVGFGTDGQHLLYGSDTNVQMLGYFFMTAILHHGSFLRSVLSLPDGLLGVL